MLTKWVIVNQLRDLEQQLNQVNHRRQPSFLSVEEECVGMGVLQKTPPQERNLIHIRTIEKERKEAFEVCVLYNNCNSIEIRTSKCATTLLSFHTCAEDLSGL